MWNEKSPGIRRLRTLGIVLALALSAWWGAAAGLVQAQDPDIAGARDVNEAQRLANEALGEEPDAAATEGEGEGAAAARPELTELKLLDLFERGGYLMWPIAVMSLVVAVFGTERLLALRRGKVIPRGLVHDLGELGAGKGGFDPRRAYKVCQRYPSAASTVIRAALLKVGRPHAEVEHTVREASEREAERLYANVRPLMLAATVTPLLGLLGTVWGMIQAFYQTATGAAATNKAELLADGIYTALVTTFAGLAVAIPSAILAHWFEGRIQTLFREIDELLLNMLPQLERYEGKLRIRRREGGSHLEDELAHHEESHHAESDEHPEKRAEVEPPPVASPK